MPKFGGKGGGRRKGGSHVRAPGVQRESGAQVMKGGGVENNAAAIGERLAFSERAAIRL